MHGDIAVGVVGAGFGRYGLVPAFRRDPRCRVVALCTASMSSATEQAAALDIPHAFGDIAEMLRTVPMKAVAIALPPQQQEQAVRAAIGAGCAVFAEKPLALDLATAGVLLSDVRRAGVAHAIDFAYPELATWTRARDLLASGAVGRVRHAVVDWRFESYDNRRRRSTWKTTSALGGGVLSHFGSHAFYNLEWLLGPLVEVSAHLGSAPDLKGSGDTLATVAVTFASAATGSLSLCSAAMHGCGHRVEIYGDTGTLTLINETADPIVGFRLAFGGRQDARPVTLAVETADEREPGEDARVPPVSRLARRFLDAVEGGPPAHPSFADGVRVQKIIDAARASAASGTRVAVAG